MSQFKSAFSYQQIQSISVGGTISDINENAFSNCLKLSSVSLNNNYCVSRFKSAFPLSQIQSVYIGDSVSEISNDSFTDCGNLSSINVDKNSLKYCSINGVLFDKDKTSLIRCPEGKSDIDYYIVPDSVNSISSNAFENCKSLTSIKFPNDVTDIGENAFSGCSTLTSVELNNDYCLSQFKSALPFSQIQSVSIGNSVSNIIDNAFADCSKLTSITIGNNVESIGENAFANCSELTQISIPTSVSTIKNSSFNGCSNLAAINVSTDNSQFCSDNGILFNKDQTSLIRCPEGKSDIDSYTIPDSVNSIDSNAFRNCQSLTSVIIPKSVTNVGSDAFNSCNQLSVVKYSGLSDPEHGDNIFEGCTNLNYVNVPISYRNTTFCEKPVLKPSHISDNPLILPLLLKAIVPLAIK